MSKFTTPAILEMLDHYLWRVGAPGLDSQAVTNELAITAQKLRAFAYARANAKTKEEAVTYRGGFGQRELMLLWPDFTGWDATTQKAKEAKEASTVARMGSHQRPFRTARPGI